MILSTVLFAIFVISQPIFASDQKYVEETLQCLKNHQLLSLPSPLIPTSDGKLMTGPMLTAIPKKILQAFKCYLLQVKEPLPNTPDIDRRLKEMLEGFHCKTIDTSCASKNPSEIVNEECYKPIVNDALDCLSEASFEDLIKHLGGAFMMTQPTPKPTPSPTVRPRPNFSIRPGL